jgi:uncharacterized protein
MPRLAHALTATLFALLPLYISSAPSFSCDTAQKRSEKLICGNRTLSTLDQILAEAYRAAAITANAPEDLQSSQRRWLISRDSCKSVRCLEAAYERRIVELRSIVDCGLELDSSTCAPIEVTNLPRTADGRLMLLTRWECRIGFGGQQSGRSQEEAIQVQADCIEAGVYDPCEDAGGKWGDAQCAWANMEVAERRIRRAQTQLLTMSRGFSNEAVVRLALENNEKEWRSYRESHCTERNRRYLETQAQGEADSTDASDTEKLGFCFRREAEERADELEEWVRALKASNSRSERTRLLADFLPEAAQRAAQPGR